MVKNKYGEEYLWYRILEYTYFNQIAKKFMKKVLTKDCTKFTISFIKAKAMMETSKKKFHQQ